MRWLPHWASLYRRSWLPGDLSAGLIVTVLLIPQSLAYAMLAGLPPQAGLYASILPLVAYAAFGTSMTLAVGPVAVISLMTATALAPLAQAGSAQYAALAMQLALLSGVMLLLFGALRLGFIAQFLSQPVLSGFITGSAILIVLNQAPHLLGVRVAADSAPAMLVGLATGLPRLNAASALIGGLALAFLLGARLWVPGLAGRLAPMAAIVLATAASTALELERTRGVAIVGAVPQGLPQLAMPLPDWQSIAALWLPALLISLVGFVESVSVARSLGAKRGERIAPDRELVGLGAANVASAVSGGYPVTGGFARSVVNFAAGANTPLAGVVSALLMAIVLAGLTEWFHDLPVAVLAATIIVAVTSLVDWDALRQTWRYDRADAFALLATLAGVLALGVEQGVLAGVTLSLGMIVWRASRPHIAVVGRVPGTEHFRNVERHPVQTLPGVLALRVDESLFFGNAAAVREHIERLLAAQPDAKRVVLILSAVNHVDATALAMLEELDQELSARGAQLALAEVKGPVMDRLARTGFGARIAPRIFLSTHQALHVETARAMDRRDC